MESSQGQGVLTIFLNDIPSLYKGGTRILWNEWLKELIASSSFSSLSIPHKPQHPSYSEHDRSTETTAN